MMPEVKQGNGNSRKLKIVNRCLVAVLLLTIVGLVAVTMLPIEKVQVVGTIVAAALGVIGILGGGYTAIQGWADGRAVTGHYAQPGYNTGQFANHYNQHTNVTPGPTKPPNPNVADGSDIPEDNQSA